jgi:hypothetical protein
MGEKRIACRILVGKPEGKRPLGRPRRRWEDNIRMDLREIGWGGMDCTDLAQDRDRWRALVNTVMNLRVHKMLGNSSAAAQLAASHEGLSSMELVSYIIIITFLSSNSIVGVVFMVTEVRQAYIKILNKQMER